MGFQFVYHLSKEYPDLSFAELALCSGKKIRKSSNSSLVFSESPISSSVLPRLAYTRNAFEVLLLAKSDISSIASAPIHKYCKYPVWIRKLDFTARAASPKTVDIVKSLLHSSKLSFSRQGEPLTLIFIEDLCLFCRDLHNPVITDMRVLGSKYSSRHPGCRPGFAPVSSDARILRAMVNMLGFRSRKMIDPFCGTAGILIEGGLIGLSVEGSDMDPIMIQKAKRNIKHFRICCCHLGIKDALTIDFCRKNIVSELPFGQSAKISKPVDQLYLQFLDNLACSRFRRAVLMFPFHAGASRIVRNLDLEILADISLYVHKNLTKQILVLEPKTL